MATTLAGKLKIKPAQTVALLDAPAPFTRSFALPGGAKAAVNPGRGTFDALLLFVLDRAALKKRVPQALKLLAANQLFWIAYPKKSGAIKSDLSQDEGWEPIFSIGWQVVSIVAVDADWSAVRVRPVSSSKPSTRSMAPPASGRDRVVIVPPALARLLARSATAQKNWDAFSYTHRKEFARWIEGAKKEETRERRLLKAIAMIEAGRGGI